MNKSLKFIILKYGRRSVLRFYGFSTLFALGRIPTAKDLRHGLNFTNSAQNIYSKKLDRFKFILQNVVIYKTTKLFKVYALHRVGETAI